MKNSTVKYYCYWQEREIDLQECESCGAMDCCEYNLEKIPVEK
jgi:Zn ribbon nucleic-acid-binding protein